VVRSGAGGVLAAATTQVVADVADLHRIVVLGPERRRGTGSALLRHAMTEAGRRGARTMMLEVRADNVAALSVYRRAGFTEIDRRPGYYGRGSDAVVMRTRLGGSDDDD
jgi:[ribosomal protein S18]-alanine N-acetyltransferase